MIILNRLFWVFGSLFVACLAASFIIPVISEHRMQALCIPLGFGFFVHALECFLTKKVVIGRPLRISDKCRTAFTVVYILIGFLLLAVGCRFWMGVLQS